MYGLTIFVLCLLLFVVWYLNSRWRCDYVCCFTACRKLLLSSNLTMTKELLVALGLKAVSHFHLFFCNYVDYFLTLYSLGIYCLCIWWLINTLFIYLFTFVQRMNTMLFGFGWRKTNHMSALYAHNISRWVQLDPSHTYLVSFPENSVIWILFLSTFNYAQLTFNTYGFSIPKVLCMFGFNECSY